MHRFLISLLIVWACVYAPAQQTQVYPRIETGAHSARANRIDTDLSGHYLFSASLDKTARVWDLRTGRLLKTLRPPMGDGDEGKLYAVAASPDGKTVAIGGFTGARGSYNHPIYIFDRESGTIRNTISGLPDTTGHLAFSRDGSYLAAALTGRKHGIRIYKTDGYVEVARDVDYGGDSYWIEFDALGRLVTTSFDGYLRLYSPDFHLLRKQASPGGKKPFSARFSPDDRLMAVGFDDSMAVDILAASDLSLQYTLQVPVADANNNELSKVVWSYDGKTVCAAGRYEEHYVAQMVCWGGMGKSPRRVFPVAGTTVMDLRALPDGGIAFCSADGAVGVVTVNGAVTWRAVTKAPDYRIPTNWPHVSTDGNTVETRADTLSDFTWQNHRLNFSVVQGKLSADGESQTTLQAPVQSGLNVANWDSDYHPTLNSRALHLADNDFSRSLAIAPNRDSFVLGSDFNIQKFDSSGNEIWTTPVPGVAYGVNITGDGRYVVAILADATIRWYRLDSGKEVLALFVDSDLQRWVAWSPDGFFTFMNGGDSLIGYQINRGPGRAGEFVKVDQLRDTFYRADLVTHILNPGGVEAIAAARNRVGDVSQALTAGLPPEIELLSTDSAVVNDDYLLQFRVRNAGGGKGRIVYRIDGTEMEGRAVDIAGTGGDTVSRYIPVGNGTHTLTVSAYSANGKIEGRPVTVRLTGRQPTSKTSLYVVSAGISHYLDNSLSDGVKFAAADANLVAATFKQQEGKGLYQRVDAVALPDSRATAMAIQNEISRAAKMVRPGDTFILYLAGHGIAVDGDYYFIPYEAEYTNQTDLLSKSMNREAIQALLKKIPTNKSVLILDTCNAGAYFESRDAASEKAAIEKVALMSGRAVLAASNSKEMAMDGYKNHGVFTYALLEGLRSADGDAQGEILITRLAEYVQRYVPEMTQEKWGIRQRPLSKVEGEPFPIAQKPAN